jgi:hypothetical protein
MSEIFIDRVALPALSIYRCGECVNVITAIAEELASDSSSFHSASYRTGGGRGGGGGELFSVDDIKWSTSLLNFFILF